MEKRYLEWAEIHTLTDSLVTRLERKDFDAVLAITRGGMVPGCLISESLDLRNVLTAAVMFYTGVSTTLDKPQFLQFPADSLLVGKRILVVDDVWESGRTIVAVKNRILQAGGKPTVATLHYKPARSLFKTDFPDLFAEQTDEWIVYPWDPAHNRAGALQNKTTIDRAHNRTV
jgi:uncharacterized protein